LSPSEEKAGKQVIVGTVGHSGHGKTALVKALIGNNLPEDEGWKITSDGGLHRHEVLSGQDITIVDLPGYKKVTIDVLRIISGINVALLVVAADQGITLETREHLEILQTFKPEEGIIVITKVDLVGEDIQKMAAAEARELAAGTFLEEAPVVYCSATTGIGIEEVNRYLDDAARRIGKKGVSDLFRLPVERVFTIPGCGTMVSGTVVSGRIRAGENVEIYPAQIKGKIRSIQVNHQKADEVDAGQQVELNIPQNSVGEVERGMVMGLPDVLIPTHLLSGRFSYLTSGRNTLVDRENITLYVSTAEGVGDMIFLDKERLLPGDTCLVQFRLKKNVVCAAGDRYFVESVRPIKTIGGGIFLEVDSPEYRTADSEAIALLKFLEQGAYTEALEMIVRRQQHHILDLHTVEQKYGLKKEEIDRAVAKLVKQKRVVWVGEGVFIHREWHDRLKRATCDELQSSHKRNVFKAAIPREELRAKVMADASPRLFDRILQELTEEHIVVLCGGGINLTGKRNYLSIKQRQLIESVEKLCREAGCEMVHRSQVRELCDGMGERQADVLIKTLVAEHKLMLLANRRLIHHEALEQIKDKIRDHIVSNGKLTLSECNDLLRIGRRRMVDVLEYLDGINFTLRIGDYRILASRSKPQCAVQTLLKS